MITIKDKINCCGCSACRQICPIDCITMYKDNEGFLYPKVDIEKCVDCGLCEAVCPVLHQKPPQTPIHVYAAKNNSLETRMQSSSGGIFTLFAEEVIRNKGIVFGACFDENWHVKHDFTEQFEELSAFRGSKYVQSINNNTYLKAEQFLQQGRTVLFSGTPCQIAGLHLFLRKEYNNLITIDLICHGVPSPEVWKRYFSVIANKYNNKEIACVSFRDKSSGWKNFGFTISNYNEKLLKNTILHMEILEENLFFKGFQKNLYLRPSCSSCCAKSLKSNSDITLGDFWGINYIKPSFDDDKGVSAVLVNTLKGNLYFSKIADKMDCWESDYSVIYRYNRSIIDSANPSKYRELFFNNYKNKNVLNLIKKYAKDSLKIKWKRKIVKILKKMNIK